MGIPPENLNNKHTNMKKIMIFSAIFAVAISLSACSNNETDISYASAETITLSSTTLNFENAGGTQTAEVESTHEFAAYSNDSWIKVTPTNPVGKKATITVTVGENLGAERTGNITIWSGGSRQSPRPRADRTSPAPSRATTSYGTTSSATTNWDQTGLTRSSQPDG